MKSASGLRLLALSLAASLAAAQFLSDSQYGSLPACTSNCPALTGPQSSCGADDWSCFCSGVWAQIEAAPTQICAQTCTNPADVALASQWYTANCGSDNGATAHPNSGGSGANGGTGTSNGNNNNNNNNNGGSGTSSGSSSSSSAASSSSSDDEAPQSWWDGHWKWVVMIIVLFFGLLGLAMLGLWLKRRHHRRRDQISGGFNQGITERAPPMSSNPHVPHDPSMLSTSAVDATSGGRDSPVRTRDAFMPYGYGYTRSESRLGSNPEIGRASSPLARGQTPVDNIERGAPMEEGGAAAHKKSRRVLVRERSGADSDEDMHR